MTASASDSDGSIAKVEFSSGATKLGEATSAPYTWTWTGVAAGSYSLSARATDNRGAQTTSSAVGVQVSAPQNQPPSVLLIAPANAATYTAPASITLTASASDADGSIAKVEFYSGATKLGEATTAPYAFNWTSVPAGSYALTALATDNAGASTTSAIATVTVNSSSSPSVKRCASGQWGTLHGVVNLFGGVSGSRS